MEPSALPTNLYDKKTFFSLGGASLGVWLFTTVLAWVFSIDVVKDRWIGLCVALAISFIGAIKFKKFDLQLGTIAFFNGLLIFVTASGVESINQGVEATKANQQVEKSAFLSFTEGRAWWPTQDLVVEVSELTQKNDSLVSTVIMLEKRSQVLRDTCITKESKDPDTQGQVTQLTNENIDLSKKIADLQKEIEALRKGKPVPVPDKAAEARGLLKELRSLNQELGVNLNTFLNAPDKPATQAEALRTMNQKAYELKIAIDDYNARITKLINQ